MNIARKNVLLLGEADKIISAAFAQPQDVRRNWLFDRYREYAFAVNPLAILWLVRYAPLLFAEDFHPKTVQIIWALAGWSMLAGIGIRAHRDGIFGMTANLVRHAMWEICPRRTEVVAETQLEEGHGQGNKPKRE